MVESRAAAGRRAVGEPVTRLSPAAVALDRNTQCTLLRKAAAYPETVGNRPSLALPQLGSTVTRHISSIASLPVGSMFGPRVRQ